MKKLSFSNNAKNNLDLTLSSTFVKDFLPYASDNNLKVYIFCLFQCQSENEDWLNTAIKSLSMTKEEIIESFHYWEELGLVSVIDGDEPEITFNEIKQRDRIRYSRGKYAEFNKQVKSILKIKELPPLELNEYYSLMEEFNLQPEYLVMAISHCTNNMTSKGSIVSYVRNVVTKWLDKGLTEISDIEKYLSDETKINKNITKILKSLGIDRSPTKSDNDLFFKWTRELGFKLGFIICVIRASGKIKSMSRLDDTLCDLSRKKIDLEEQVQIYFDKKNEYTQLAIEINKKLSYYDNNIDNVIDNYIQPWKNKGFSNDSLLLIAKYCYLINKKTLMSMNTFIEMLYSKGIVSDSDINLFLEKMQSVKMEFSKLCANNGLNIEITQNVIQNYIIWRDNWNMNIELIGYAIQLSIGTESPIRYISTTLNSWFKSGIKTVNDAKNYKFSTKNDSKNGWHADQIGNSNEDNYSHLFINLSEEN